MRTIGIIIIALILAGCSGRVAKEQEALSAIIGKEVVFPEGMVWQIQNTPIDYDSTPADYRIVTYVDSAGCTPCQMKLPLWNGVMDELAAAEDTDIELLVVVRSPKTFEIDYMVRNSDFLHLICYDSAGVFSSHNEIPAKAAHRTFLLDSGNRIIAVGNPTINPKVRDLYKRLILEEEGLSKEERLCSTPVFNFGMAHAGDTIIRQFELQNKGDRLVSIQGLTPSCDCVTASFTQPTISPGGSTRIEVAYIADSIPGRKHRHVDVYYTEKEDPERLTLYGHVITK